MRKLLRTHSHQKYRSIFLFLGFVRLWFRFARDGSSGNSIAGRRKRHRSDDEWKNVPRVEKATFRNRQTANSLRILIKLWWKVATFCLWFMVIKCPENEWRRKLSSHNEKRKQQKSNFLDWAAINVNWFRSVFFFHAVRFCGQQQVILSSFNLFIDNTIGRFLCWLLHNFGRLDHLQLNFHLSQFVDFFLVSEMEIYESFQVHHLKASEWVLFRIIR